MQMWYKMACSGKNATVKEDYYQSLLEKKSPMEKEIDKVGKHTL